MAKRFGRNQKRAMRNRIQSLEWAIESQKELFEQVRDERNQLRVVVERTSQVLGDHFVSLPVKTVEVEDILDRFRVSIFQPNRVSIISSAVMRALDCIEMDIYQSSLHADELRQQIHLRFASISGQVGYSISDAAWLALSEAHLRDLVMKQIAPEMAKLLIQERKKHYQ